MPEHFYSSLFGCIELLQYFLETPFYKQVNTAFRDELYHGYTYNIPWFTLSWWHARCGIAFQNNYISSVIILQTQFQFNFQFACVLISSLISSHEFHSVLQCPHVPSTLGILYCKIVHFRERILFVAFAEWI